jgi:cyclic pyranopterin phosphate synthase
MRNSLLPVKLNMVVMKGINDYAIWEMAEFASNAGAILQLIELEADKKTWGHGLYKKYHFDFNGIERTLAEDSLRVEENEMHHRRKYLLPGDTEIEIVRPMHNTEFCAHCNRIRLTPDGKLKPCLFETSGLVDLIGPLRDGASTTKLKTIFKNAIKSRKPYWR